MLFGWRLREPQSLTSGYGLLAGALLASFSLLAAWRNNLTQRPSWQVETSRTARRAIDEAVAHVLMSILVCVGLAALTVIMANVMTEADGSADTLRDTPALVLTSVLVSLSTYLILSLVLIVNLLRDAYHQVNEADEKDARRSRNHDRQTR
ncbi:hypothetical protein M3697_11255 [Janibacter melonis]|uniref:hypothetical protein n=1 Tax=Janibacter melonis TaxID=262209 RepID=UPI002042DE9C|nr:hypothetical protein [Janibacter melonis]MCM3555680.1 hypothetical protein [Janibacter melonis]